MFDKLIVSEPDRTEVQHRRNYFMVSTVVVGLLFITGVVISIFAADFGLGNSSFELTEIVAPLDLAAAAQPEPIRPRIQVDLTHSEAQVPTRTSNMSRVDEPTIVPNSTSSASNAGAARPLGQFQIGKLDSDPGQINGTGRDTTGGPSGPTGLGIGQVTTSDANTETNPPARITKPPVRQNLGVINGKATYLPKPAYSAAARAVNAQGQVSVQVSIDEAGHVTSANAVNGHPLLRAAAEQAAREAKFSITYLSHEPVKVSGVIVYNFVR